MPRLRLRGRDLRSVDLAQLALDGADLREADLRGADLSGRDLAGADLRGARLDGACLSRARLADADLDGASLAGVTCDGADLRRTVALGARCGGLRADGARLEGAEWRHADLRDAVLTRVDGRGWRLDGACLAGADLDGARLERAVLDDADIAGARFRGGALQGCAMAGARGVADFEGAAIEGADLRLVHLAGCLPEVHATREELRRGSAGARLRAWVTSTAATVAGTLAPLRRVVWGDREQTRPAEAEIDFPVAAAARARSVESDRDAADDRARLRALRSRPAQLGSAAPPRLARAVVPIPLSPPIARSAAAGAWWALAAGGRVARAGLLRGAPAAYEALAEEANVGARGDDRASFEVDAALRERRLARVGIAHEWGARRAVAHRERRHARVEAGAVARVWARTVHGEASRMERELRARCRPGRPGPAHLRVAASASGYLPPLPGEIDALGRLRGTRRSRRTIGPGARLERQRLDDFELAGAGLVGALLGRASLVGADLRGADLRDADLRRADLTAAWLGGADLRGARLEGAVLHRAELVGVRLDGARVDGALVARARGMDDGLRARLGAGGADLGFAADGRWFRVGSGVAAFSVLVGVAAYLGARFAGSDMDSAAREHAAATAAASGDAAGAAEHFLALAESADSDDDRARWLLEAASAREEAGDGPGALAIYERAVAASRGSDGGSRVRLARARALARGEQQQAAAVELRSLANDVGLATSERAEAVVALAAVLDGTSDVRADEDALIAGATTPTERTEIVLALADAWSGAGRADRALATLEHSLDVDASVLLRLRYGRALADAGDTDGALIALTSLAGEPGGERAALEASDLHARRGAFDEAAAVLAPILGRDGDLGARARVAAAQVARRRGDEAGAIVLLRQAIAMDGVEPRVADEARLALARVLAVQDPDAAAAIVSGSPELVDAWRLGQADELRASGKVADARRIWVAIADAEGTEDASRAEAEIAIAELDADAGDTTAAIARYERLTRTSPIAEHRRRAQLGVATALLRAGRVAEAEARWRALLTASADPEVAARCRLGLAQAAALRGQTERAAAAYLEVADGDSTSAVEALEELARLRRRTGDSAGEIAALRRAVARPGLESATRAQVELDLAAALVAAGDPEAGALYARLVAAPDPDVRVRARLALGERAEDPAAALVYFEAALAEAGPGEARSAVRAGWLRATIVSGAAAEGLTRVRAWLDTESDAALRGELALAAVQALRAEGRIDDALALAGKHAQEGGFELGMERASMLRDAGRVTDAADAYAALSPATAEDDAWRLEGQIAALVEAGDAQGARAAVARLAGLPTGGAAAAVAKARLAREAGDLEGALVAAGGVDDPRAAVERAMVLEGLGRADEAEAAWRGLAAAAELESRSAGMIGLARVRLARGDAEGALAQLGTIVELDPAFELTRAQIRGEALRELGRWAEAEAVYAALGADAEARTVGALGLGECALGRGETAIAEARFLEAERSPDAYYRAAALAGVVRARWLGGDAAGAAEFRERLAREFPDQEEARQAAGVAPR